MDFYNLFDSFAQLDILASMIMPFLDVAVDGADLFERDRPLFEESEEASNLYNMYEYNAYYIYGDYPAAQETVLSDNMAQITNNAFYNFISEEITQSKINNTALSFAEYLKSDMQINEHTKNYSVFGDSKAENNYYANSVKKHTSSFDSFFQNSDVDKVINGIEARLVRELEASPYGVYS